MIWFDKHPEVVWWQSEEIIVPYFDTMTRKNRRYFPDFVFERNNKYKDRCIYMVEVKPYCQTIEPIMKKGKAKKTMLNEVTTYATNTSKWKHARTYCEKMKWEFIIVTENELKKMGLL